MPIISVVIPTYNRPEELRRALRSVLSQTHKDFEVIVVDDGMRVPAADVVKNFNDPRVRYIPQEVSRGSSAARNIGVRAASGEYVAFLDDTDEWMPEKLETQHKVFSELPASVAAVIVGGKIITTNGEDDVQSTLGTTGLNEGLLKNLKAVPMSAQMIRRSVFSDIGYFDESLPSHQNIDIIFRIAEKHPIHFVPEKLVSFHTLHNSGGGEGLEGVERRIRGREVLLRKHEELMQRYADVYAGHYFTLGLWYRDLGQHQKAIENFSRAFQLSRNPRYAAHWIVGYLRDRMS